MSAEQSIGVFDSGIGGLTVVKELFSRVPHERIVYFGDTARVPYGSKSVETVRRYAREDTELLLRHHPKLIVVACNTVSAVALDVVKSLANGIPVIGMIEPACKEAIRVSASGKIGIIGTDATISSKAYETELRNEAKRMGKEIETFAKACPLFVPLAEEGWEEKIVAELVAREYLHSLHEAKVDTLILGCTHYPVLSHVIQTVMGAGVTLINSGAIAAQEVKILEGDAGAKRSDHVFFVSDIPRKFQSLGERFLGRELPTVKQVTYEEAWVIEHDS
ncbi:MAG: glutamate racemase [Bacteroidota bacterium]|nr:glutamate racemase [Bacteroidota bacterium]MDP4229083.1 glutamate racemase [Bacteroidota bacterium]MDP4235043.1 glutamate racemase [Bacteroidota bacterium]